MSRGIFYRGDDRRPRGIHSDGFGVLRLPMASSSSGSEPPLPHSGLFQFPDDNEDIAPDVAPGKVVCVTRDFFAAAIFPVDMSTETYIYALDLDTKYLLNTQAAQYRYVQSIAKRLTPEGTKTALWPMFGQERAATEVAASDIVGSLKVERKWFSPDNPFAGGSFRATEPFFPNEDYQGSRGDAVRAAIEETMRKAAKPDGWVPIPTKAQGIARVEHV